MGKTQVAKKVGKIAVNILIYIFIAVSLFSVTLTIFSKKDADGAATIFGIQMRSVLSASMEKCDQTDVSKYKIKDIPTGSLVFIETVPEDPEEAEQWYADLEIGDVLTFKYVYVKQETITHRVTGIRANPGGGYTIRLDGDNKNSNAETLTQTIDTSEPNSPNYIIGKVKGQSYLLGQLIRALKSPTGLVFIVIVPALIIVMLEIIKIAKILGADKQNKDKEELERQKNELEILKRRLEELEGEKAADESAPDDASAETVAVPEDTPPAES